MILADFPSNLARDVSGAAVVAEVLANAAKNAVFKELLEFFLTNNASHNLSTKPGGTRF